MKPKFVIGIGSQRAGSTLLHTVLTQCTPVFMHPVKELHYYDTLLGIRNKRVLHEYSKHQLSLLEGREQNTKREVCNFRTNNILAHTQIEKVDYIDLYRPCILGKHAIGEITPEYMILPEEGIKKMRDDLGENTKIILISRDPIERFISSVKLLKLYGGKVFDMKGFEEELLNVIDEMPAWMEQQDQLNDYEGALKNYSKYFPHILFLSYEQMITNPLKIHKELEAFFGIDIDVEEYQKIFSKKVNAIGKTGDISNETREMLKIRYQNSIEFLENYFKDKDK